MTTTTRSIALAALVLLSAACASGPPAAPVASSTINLRPGCNAAPTEAVASIMLTLIGDAKKIDQAYYIDENNRQYVGANIYDAAGKSLSDGDVWIIDHGTVYALSNGARTNSKAADGRELPDKPTAGVGNSRFVANCAHPV